LIAVPIDCAIVNWRRVVLLLLPSRHVLELSDRMTYPT
jgi:hypothetical protein